MKADQKPLPPCLSHSSMICLHDRHIARYHGLQTSSRVGLEVYWEKGKYSIAFVECQSWDGSSS